MKRIFSTFLLSILALPVAAVEPAEILTDLALEQRARAISQTLRCLVCRNESIDESNADLARDLRLLVRRRLQAGDNDSAVIEFVVERYGEYVLLTPKKMAQTGCYGRRDRSVWCLQAELLSLSRGARPTGGAQHWPH